LSKRSNSFKRPKAENACLGLEPGGHSQWRNETGRNVAFEFRDVSVPYWPSCGLKSFPNTWAEKLMELNMTFVKDLV